MAAIDYGTGPNTSTGDLMPAALGKLRDRLAARGFDPGSLGSDIATALARIEVAMKAAEAAYVPGTQLLLTITGTALAATVGVPYSFTPNVAYATGTVAFTLTGTLPAGLTFDPATGAITGTPTAAANFTGSIGAVDSKSSVLLAISFSVTSGAVTPVTLNALTVSNPTATVGTSYSGTISGLTAGSSVALSGPGAAGLSIGGAVISGTPTAAGAINLVETLAGATNSPRTTAAVVTVSAAGGAFTPTALSAFTNTYDPDAVTLFTAYDAVGTRPLRDREKYSMNRYIKRLKNSGQWASKSWVIVSRRWAQNEAQAIINWRDPSKKLTKVGSPTWTAAVGFSGLGAGNKYQTDVPLSAISADSFHQFYWTPATATGAGAAVGAIDANGNGLTLNGSNGSSQLVARNMGAPTTSTADTAYYNGRGGHCQNRLGSEIGAGNVSISRNGPRIETMVPAAAPAAITTGELISIGGVDATGYTGTVGFYSLGSGLTQDQEEELGAIATDMHGASVHGEPIVLDVGQGPSTINADIVITGMSGAAVDAAYQIARLFPTQRVILLGEAYQSSLQHLGGHPAEGLGWSDVYNGAIYSGIWWDSVRYVHQSFYAGASDPSRTAGFTSQFQTGTSFEGRAWNAVSRRKLDSTKTGTYVPGVDVPIVFTTGYSTAANRNGGRGATITTNDGRTINCRYFAVGDYNANILQMLGLPVTVGAEAAGTGQEAKEGYILPATLPTVQTVGKKLSPYDTDGVTLLPDIGTLPSLTVGQADPGAIQADNIRDTWTNQKWRSAPLVLRGARTQSAKRFEAIARLMATSSSFNQSDLFNATGTPVVSGQVFDINNGKCQIATDVPGSGAARAQTTTDAQRRAIAQDIRDRTLGQYSWILNSGDTRIPSAFRTDVSGYYHDALHYTDPEPDWLRWLGEPYRREPMMRMKSSFVWDANDISDGNGASLGRVLKPIGQSSYYGFDKHSCRVVAYNDGGGTYIYIQGDYQDNGVAGGADYSAPVPLDMFYYDKATNDYLVSLTAPSMTSRAFCFWRMEPNMSMAAEFVGAVLGYAAANDIAVQDVPYQTVRAQVLAASNSVPLTIPALKLAGTPSAATVGTAYSFTPTATMVGGSVAYSIASGALPGGLTLNTSTGNISGTPTASGTFAATLQGVDQTGSTATLALSITVAAAAGSPTISGTPGAATTGTPYTFTPTTSGGTSPYTYAITAGALPAGTTLNTSTGVVTGTPTAAGTANFTITVTDANSQTSSLATSIVVTASAAVTETFAGTSGTALASRPADTGQTWSVIGAGDFVLDGSNGAYSNNVVAKDTIAYTPTSADYVVRARMHCKTVVANHTIAVAGRVAGATSMYMFGYRGSASGWQLMKYVGTTLTLIGSTSAATLVAGSDYNLELSMVGTSLVGKVNGTTVCTATDSDLTAAGLPGLMWLAGTSTATAGYAMQNYSVVQS